MIFPGTPINDELKGRIDTVLRWEAEHGPVLQFGANDWTRADQTFTEVLEGMGPFLPAHHNMLEDMVADGTQQPLAVKGWTWRAVTACGCCLFWHAYQEGSKACSYATDGVGDDRCSVGSAGWQDLLRRLEETPGCPDPKRWASVVAKLRGLPEPQAPGPVPPDRPWPLTVMSRRRPSCRGRRGCVLAGGVPGGDDVAVGLHLLT